MRPAIPLTLSLAALLVGCGGKNVPADALAEIRSERVDALAAIQAEDEDVERELAQADDLRKRLRKQVSQAEGEVRRIDRAWDDAQQARVEAVESGQSALVESRAATVEALDEERMQARAVLLDLRDALEEQELRVDTLDARSAWLDAHLEHQRALAAVDGGADLKLRPYERRARKLQDRYDQTRQEWVASLEPDEREEAGVSLQAG